MPKYMSAVRQMQLTLTGVEVCPYPFVQHVMREYKWWEEDHYQMATVRFRLSAEVLQRI